MSGLKDGTGAGSGEPGGCTGTADATMHALATYSPYGCGLFWDEGGWKNGSGSGFGLEQSDGGCVSYEGCVAYGLGGWASGAVPSRYSVAA
ncbi:hypothetical protein N4P33_06590 [Streptomyces sp. 15-116A]|uniref:hypothetical protein n=1 Tax=Streptomyces sp. 15-116A TaxID=2259035 RepID=UPI0021B163A4|nr:hypothetical protein [Streptomyces sp. 15-116A]MCT7351841.1 hypothetical protein [Streptomyces sp. 15-116A]